MSEDSKSGKVSILFSVTKGTLIEGDALTALADNSWFLINKRAASGTQLPLGENYIFKTPDSANAITPIVDDDVYPLTFTKICKADATIATEKGNIDVTDDCEEGYNAYISDGFTDISGSVNAHLKFNVPGGGVPTKQEEFLARFFDIVDDDGAGTYTLTAKNDDELILAILMNSDQITVGDIQVWLLTPAILTGIALDKPLKGVQTFNFNWQKAQNPASIYNRITNSSETVF